ncbi:Caffeic acid 3-O-methyltransferase [Linum perenne]
MEQEHRHELYAMQLATASVTPMALKAAIELGVFDIINSAGAGASLSPAQIASKLASTMAAAAASDVDDRVDSIAERLDPILQLLSSHSILTCDDSGDGLIRRSYGLAPVARFFVKDGGGSLMHLKDSVLEGGGNAFYKAYGMNGGDYMGKDQRFREAFFGSISELSPLIMEAFLERYSNGGFQGVETLVDVGGGNGSSIHLISSRVPTIRKAINFDLPFVLEKSTLYSGVEHVAGDMFESVPKGDAIFMKWILHLWDDEQCLKILSNCYNALPENGKVVAIDALVPETSNETTDHKALLQFSLYRMNTKPQGKERTLTQFDSLAKQVGFSRARIACYAYNFAVFEFIKLETSA